MRNERLLTWLALTFACLLGACTSTPPAPATAPALPHPPHAVPPPPAAPRPAPAAPPAAPTVGAEKPPGFAVVKTFFATDREAVAGARAAEAFGGRRSATIQYGVCEVSIPRDHRMGVLESPSLLRLEFHEDPNRDVMVLSTALATRERFFAELSERVKRSPGKNAFLFVHGYNVTFADAARRTAQMAYDLGFDGAPTFYSWPSQGTTVAYTLDEQNIEWAQSNLRRFLEEFAAGSDADNIFLIAHSMGSRALTRAAISFLQDHPESRSRFKEIILAAPDIDADVFKRDIAPQLASVGRPITLYASAKDRALLASKEVHGYPRVGEIGATPTLFSGIETIDSTSVDTSLLGHSYFADTRSVLSDIFLLVRDGKSADQRPGLSRIDATEGRYWVFKR